MEPVTHLLTGAVLARAGCNRRAAYATAAMVIAAELPDIDVLWSVNGPLAGFEHHRGITHTFLGIPFEAALVILGFYAYHRLRTRRSQSGLQTKAPVRWPLLFVFALLALLSHLFLDWTNNYGLRPFFPFNPRWYAGSFVFIFDPVLFVLLLLALLGPLLFGLINSEVGARKPPFPGRAGAIISLLAVVALWLFRFTQHAAAIHLISQNLPTASQGETVIPDRISASPYPANPFRWHIVLDTPAFYQLATVDTRTRTVAPPSPEDTLYKPASTLPLLAAKRTWLGRIYLDWSQYPVLAESTDTSDPTHPLSVITFSDARFFYDTFLNRGRSSPPLTGSVTLDMQAPEGRRVQEITMDGRVQMKYIYLSGLQFPQGCHQLSCAVAQNR